MRSDSKLTNPDGYDKVISAEIPDKDMYPVLHALVVKHMVHGPCGALKKNCPCMIDGECRFRYPRQFYDATEQGKDSYPIYRRRHDGRRVKVRGAELDNREACEKRGLIETDKSLNDCLTESATFQMPRALRRLFATILVFCEATNIRSLWEKHLDSMSEDYLRNHPNKAAVEQMVLRDIRDLVHSMGKDIGSYGLPDLDPVDDGCSSGYSREVQEEMSIIPDKKDINSYTSLNTEQRTGFDEILSHVVDKRSQVFFVDGPGGTGKTYLYKALLAKVHSLGQIAIATATSGIAASIMPGGRTAHSRFKIPIKLTDSSMCNFTKQSGTADLLRKASLIIWDEVAMTKRQTVETLDRSLQDIMGCDLPFGGKVVVFGGDFRQVLPVVTRGTRAQITDATLRRSHLWEKIRKIRLTRNMRAQTDPWFSSYLLRIGNGTEETIGGDYKNQ
ncbi:uncharacterized protein [Lolium perenne]|uniref:uncharacterized protein n=1 Tax=Lolium perenne TaxID=4522 RepID=UPI003A99BCE7